MTALVMYEARTSLAELARLFLRLGATAFGGPAAHIAMMQEEVVKRRRWLSEQSFLDLLGATNLIPGPNSTEMAIHIGWQRRRWWGLLVAGVCFIVPAMLITATIAWLYVRYGTLPETGFVLYGIKPVILAVVVQAILGLAPTAARTNTLRGLGVAVMVAAAWGGDELLLLALAGLAALFANRPKPNVAVVWPWLGPTVVGSIAAKAVNLPGLFWVFLKTGSVLYGSGYVLLAFLRSALVQQLHWLTDAQLIDAVAVGQVTPGPVFTTATFVGYVLAGPMGALVATLGIFAPAFVFVAASGPLIPWLRASPAAGAFLDGVNVASLALMAVVTWQLAQAALVDVPTCVLAVAGAVALVRFRVNSAWLVLAGAFFGWALKSNFVGV